MSLLSHVVSYHLPACLREQRAAQQRSLQTTLYAGLLSFRQLFGVQATVLACTSA